MLNVSRVRFGDIGVVYCKDEKSHDAKALLSRLEREYHGDFYYAENWNAPSKIGHEPRFIYTTGQQKKDVGREPYRPIHTQFQQYTMGSNSRLRGLTCTGLESINGSIHVQQRASFCWHGETGKKEGLTRSHWIA